MNPAELDVFRRSLLDERARVLAAVEHLRRENAGSLEEEAAEALLDNHLAETASVTLDREIDYSLEENEARLLEAIDGALARLDDGTFGTCASCGEPIDLDRLRAVPYATLCIACKRREEHG